MSGENTKTKGRVIRAVFNYGLGSYLPQVVGFFLIPLYTHYIAPREMGVLELCLSAQALFIILMRLGLSSSLTRFYFDHQEGPQLRDMVTTVVGTIVGFSLLLVGMGLLAGPYIFARLLPDVPYYPFIPISLVTAFFLSVADFQRRLLEARERSGFSARLSVAFGVSFTLLTLLLVVGFGMGVLGVLWSNLLVAVIFAIVAIWNHWDDLRGDFRREHLRNSLAYGLPLVPHHGAAWAQQFIGRWVLGGIAATALVGELGVAAKVASPLALITGAFATAYSPVYFSWRSNLTETQALSEARRITRTVLALGAIAVIGAATFGGLFVRYALQASYRDAAPLVGVIAVALFAQLMYTVVAVEIFYAKKTKWISIVFVLSAALNLLLVLSLAGRYGALAAAGAQLGGGIASVVVVSLLAKRTFPLPYGRREVITATCCCMAACLFALALPSMGFFGDLWKNAAAFVALSGLTLIWSGALPQLSGVGSLLRAQLVRAGGGARA